MLYHALFELGVDVVWCGHYDFNDNSRRVIEKCGFSFVFRREEMLYHMDDRFCYACYYAMDRGITGRCTRNSSRTRLCKRSVNNAPLTLREAPAVLQ